MNSLSHLRNYARLLIVLPLLWLALFFFLPVVSMFAREFTLASFTHVLSDSATHRILWFTTWQAAASTILTLALAWPVTWACSRYSFRGRRAVRGIVSTPFVLPTVVVAAAIRSSMPAAMSTGIVPILLAHVLFNIAVVVRIVGARWEQERSDLVDTARTLGLSPLRAFVRVTMPRLRGSLTAAASVVFVFCFTSFGVVRILGGSRRSTLEVEIFFRAVQLGDVPAAVALSLIQIVVVMVVAALVAREPYDDMSAARVLATPARHFPARRRAVIAACSLTVAAVSVPFVSMLAHSFRAGDGWSVKPWIRLFDGSFRAIGVDVPSSIANSLVYAAVASAVAVPLAVCVASTIAYSTRPDALTRFAGAAVFVPLATSAVVLGLGVIIAFDSSPIDWRAHWGMFPATFSVIALPLMVRTLVPPLRAIPLAWRDAAATLGASPIREWWSVDMRTLRRPIATATGLCAAVSLGEFGATSFLTRDGHSTLPVVIARLLARPGDLMQSSGYALSCVMVAVVATVMARA